MVGDEDKAMQDKDKMQDKDEVMQAVLYTYSLIVQATILSNYKSGVEVTFWPKFIFNKLLK